MAKTKQRITPTNLNPNWIVTEEFTFDKDVIVPGDKVKIKFVRGEFKFIRHIYHTQLDVQWIDCVNSEGYRSFYIVDLKGKIKPKKFRKKKNVD